MKAMAGIYLVCLAASVLVFAIFPAEDTYVFPTAVSPVERIVETRVVEQTLPDTTITRQIEVNVKDITAIEQRLTAWERWVGVESEDADQRIKNATRDLERKFNGKVWILLGAFGLAWFMAAAAFVRTLRRWAPGGPVTTPPSSKSQPGREK